jgi:hypothetical protein
MTAMLVTELKRSFSLAYSPNALKGTRNEFWSVVVTDEMLL